MLCECTCAVSLSNGARVLFAKFTRGVCTRIYAHYCKLPSFCINSENGKRGKVWTTNPGENIPIPVFLNKKKPSECRIIEVDLRICTAIYITEILENRSLFLSKNTLVKIVLNTETPPTLFLSVSRVLCVTTEQLFCSLPLLLVMIPLPLFCLFVSISFPESSLPLSNKDLWGEAIRNDRILGLPALLRMCSTPCSWTSGLTAQVRRITLSQSSLLVAPPLGKGNEDSGNEIVFVSGWFCSANSACFFCFVRSIYKWIVLNNSAAGGNNPKLLALEHWCFFSYEVMSLGWFVSKSLLNYLSVFFSFRQTSLFALWLWWAYFVRHFLNQEKKDRSLTEIIYPAKLLTPQMVWLYSSYYRVLFKPDLAENQ